MNYKIREKVIYLATGQTGVVVDIYDRHPAIPDANPGIVFVQMHHGERPIMAIPERLLPIMLTHFEAPHKTGTDPKTENGDGRVIGYTATFVAAQIGSIAPPVINFIEEPEDENQ